MVSQKVPSEDHIELTPISRLTLSLDMEMNLDKGALFGKETHEKYIAMLTLSELKRDKILRSLFLIDCALAIVLSGKNISIPGTQITTGDLPAVIECLTAAASIGFLFLAVAFTNVLCYSQIADQFNIRSSRQSALDPEYLHAAEHYFEFIIKIYRRKFNIWGEDFFQPNRRFIFVSIALATLLCIGVMSLPLIHLALVSYSMLFTLVGHKFNLVLTFYCALIFCSNVGAILLIVLNHVSFAFTITKQKENLG